MSISEMLQDVFIVQPKVRREFEVQGEELARLFNPLSALKLAEKGAELGRIEIFQKFLDLFIAATEFWRSWVKDVTGVDIYFDVNARRWRREDTGEFTYNPVRIVRMSKGDIEEEFKQKYIK